MVLRSQCYLRFDPGTLTLDAPTSPWEPQRPPGGELSSCLPVALVDLSWRALHGRHVYIVMNGPEVLALRCFPRAFLFSHFYSVWTLSKILSKTNSFLFSILRRHSLNLDMNNHDS